MLELRLQDQNPDITAMYSTREYRLAPDLNAAHNTEIILVIVGQRQVSWLRIKSSHANTSNAILR